MNDDELGAVLREALHARVRDIEPSSALLGRVDQISASSTARGPHRRRGRFRRRLLAAMPIPVAVTVAAIIVALSGSEVTPSFAVVAKPSGDVLVTINDLSGVAGANARLQALHVDAVVVPMTADCPHQVDVTYLGVHDQSVRLSPVTLPPDTTIVLAARQIGPNKVEMAFGRVTGTPPACVAAQGTGPGLPGWPGPASQRQQTTGTQTGPTGSVP